MPVANTRRYLITGGAGYIGSHIHRLIPVGADCLIVDWCGQDSSCSLRQDFASDQALEIVRRFAPTVIMHMAADHIVAESVREPNRFYENNVVRTWRLLDEITKWNHRPQIVFSSTAAVYGDTDGSPLTEQNETNPCNPYGNTKLAVERMLADYWQAYEIPSICFRYFNAAGAEPYHHDLGQPAGASHIIARLLEAQIRQQIFTLHGNDYATADGTCIRDYIHVQDIARAHFLALDYLDREPTADRFNLGVGQGTSNQEIIDIVESHYGKVQVQIGPRRAGDPARLVADAGRARQILGWEPEHSSIENIVDTAYRWYQKTLTTKI